MAHPSLSVLVVLLLSSALSATGIHQEHHRKGLVEEAVEESSKKEHSGSWYAEHARGGRSGHVDSPAYRHYVNSRVSNASIQADLQAKAFYRKCKTLLSNEDNANGLPLVVNDICRCPSFKCPSITNIYRTYDGTCNNIHRPGCGRANSAFLRLLPADYNDGINEVRRSVTGHPLPHPREIQLKCFGDQEVSSIHFTQFFAQWASYISQDMSFSPMKQKAYGPFQCCESDCSGILPPSKLSDACYPIHVPPSDPFYKRYGVRCMEFVRAMTVVPDDCLVQPANPMNGVTSYLDLSVLYGNDDMTIKELREYKAGNLSVSDFYGEPFLPLMPDSPHPCASQHPSDTVCFKSGDPRSNMHPLRTVMQLLFLRAHNRLSKAFGRINPHWKEEKVFQEARRLLIAIWQHVVYDEMLPLLIGKKEYKKHFHVYKYDKELCPGTYVEFSNVFRYLHTMVHGILRLMTPDREITKELVLSEFYNRPTIVTTPKAFDLLLIGAVTQKCRKGDVNYEKEVAHELFKTNKTTFGLSLPCIDTQRGRDHGVPRYNKLRKLCGLPEAEDFDDLSDTMTRAAIEKLSNIYEDVNDIDLLVGGAMERKISGALLGPTFACLIAKQFNLTQRSDRFFYLNKDQEYPFTERQIESIKRSSAAAFLCINTCIKKIQKKAFEAISVRNPLMHCNEILTVDMTPWKEDASWKKESSWVME